MDTTADDLSRPTLARVLDLFGSRLLSVAGPSEIALGRPVTGVQVFDPLADPWPLEGHLLIAIGADPSTADAVALVERAAKARATAVVFRAPGRIGAEVLEAAGPDLAVLEAASGVDWGHLITVLRMGVRNPPVQELDGVPLGDLFGLANALARRLAGAVTIEDPQSRVLAYSSVQTDLDEPRKETILGRAVPAKYTRILQERGVLRQLSVSDEVVEMEAIPDVGLRRRLAVRIQAADEMLGSIWIAEAGTPLTPDATEILREAAKTAVLHIMRHRMDLHYEASLHEDLTRDLLLGGEMPPDVAATRLGMEPHASYAVVAFESVGRAMAISRLVEIISLYCSAFGYSAPIVNHGPRVYALAPAPQGPEGERGTRRFATDAVRRASDALRSRVVAGVGPTESTAARIPSSRADADRALRVLLQVPDMPAVASLEDVHAHATLLELFDILQERPHLKRSGLAALSAVRRGDLLRETLHAYLSHFGDVAKASQAIHCHPNTFRYRLKRALEVTGLDLDDPAQRLVTTLLLELETES